MSSHARILTSVPRHPKFLRAGSAASWLWLCGVCYCQDALTDGFISKEAVFTLGVSKPLPLAATLVEVGLWHAREDGWQIHDYLDHNNSAEYVNRIRQERKAAGQKGGRARSPLIKMGNQLDEQVAWDLLEQLPEPTGNPTINVNGTPSTISGTNEQQERADAPTPPVENRVDRMRETIRRHRRRRSNETDDGKPAARVITALARHVVAEHPHEQDDGELRELLKAACARANLRYDSVTVGNALEAAKAQLRRSS